MKGVSSADLRIRATQICVFSMIQLGKKLFKHCQAFIIRADVAKFVCVFKTHKKCPTCNLNLLPG